MKTALLRVVMLLAAAFVLLAVAAAIYWQSLSRIKSDYFVQRSGRVEAAAVTPVPAQAEAEIIENVSLSSSSGLRVRLRTRRPTAAEGSTWPVVVIVGGHRTGRLATDLVEDLSGIAFVAIDYPYEGSVDVYGVGDALEVLPNVRQAFMDTPPALMLTLRWLHDQDWVDTEQVELAGVSLGVPFAAAAGALEAGFSRVWLVHGGLDNESWVNYALRRHIDRDWLRKGVARLLLQLVNGASFDTVHWIRKTQPRPVVVIAALDDDRVPLASKVAVDDLSRSGFIELVATYGRHIGPGRERELDQLLRIVKERVNVTAAARRAR